MGSWRPIALCDTSYRLFATILNNRLLKWISGGKLISPFQKALLAHDGCAEHNNFLNAIQENYRIHKTESHLVFLDLKEAFPSLPHELVWFVLEKSGCHPRTIRLLKQIYADNHTFYQCETILSERIRLVKGVRQGCPLSMTLFCLSIDFLIQKVGALPNHLRLLNTDLFMLAYADDLVLIARNSSELHNRLNLLQSLTNAVHLVFNAAKCHPCQSFYDHYP